MIDLADEPREHLPFLHEVLLLIILSINNNSPLSEEGFVHPQAPNRMFRVAITSLINSNAGR